VGQLVVMASNYAEHRLVESSTHQKKCSDYIGAYRDKDSIYVYQSEYVRCIISLLAGPYAEWICAYVGYQWCAKVPISKRISG
jgi:hypothetical protein